MQIEGPAILPPSILEQLDNLPDALLSRSGSAFHSGLHAFTGQKPLYLLGLNPGGDPMRKDHVANTIAKQIAERKAATKPWSAYADEEWNCKPAGTSGMQPRLLYLLSKLGMHPHHVPASNVIFVRTRNEASLRAEKAALLDICWPFHKAVIETLGVKVIICYGQTAGRWVREKLDVVEEFDSDCEKNKRQWRWLSHGTRCGRTIITATHPSRANWINPACDPSGIIKQALDCRQQGDAGE